MRLTFNKRILVKRIDDFIGSAHGFDFKQRKKILECTTDVIGQFGELFAFSISRILRLHNRLCTFNM